MVAEAFARGAGRRRAAQRGRSVVGACVELLQAAVVVVAAVAWAVALRGVAREGGVGAEGGDVRLQR